VFILWTPLHLAASASHIDVVEYLIKHGADIKAVNNEGRTPLFYSWNQEIQGLLSNS